MLTYTTQHCSKLEEYIACSNRESSHSKEWDRLVNVLAAEFVQQVYYCNLNC